MVSMLGSMIRGVVGIVAGVALVQPLLGAQAASQSLGTVSVSRRVLANGQTLAAGTYTLRLVADTVSPVVGQTPAESRWVEFVRGGKVIGRELATVLTGAEAKAVVRGQGPASGSSKTELLKGGDYLRIWVNRGGTHYLVHLAVARAA